MLHHQQHLGHNLARGQIALQAHQGGEAELAIHRTAHLRGDANGVAVILRHQHGFNGAAVGHVEQVTPRAVGGVEALIDVGQTDGQIHRQALAQSGGQRRHLLVIQDALGIDVFKDLLGPIGGFGLERLLEFGQVHANY